jgi:2'-hydroxyisoflavone reductase
MPSRRRFLQASVATVGLGCARGRSTPPPAVGRELLVLGGTGFIGPHLVRHAVARGHRVTIFTRGRTQAALPEGVTRLIGDRDGKLDALQGRRFDAVIDDSATKPERVQLSTQLLKDSVGRYLFTSSTGVYYPYLQAGADEARAVRVEAMDPEDGSAAYGVAKAQCEREVLRVFGARGTVVRPTYIVGPGDTTDRFPYWPQRLARGGEVLAPGRRGDAVQWIDVRDLAEFMLRLIEDDRAGIYNVVGPGRAWTIEEFLAQAQRAVGGTGALTWIEDYEFLTAQEIFDSVPWVMLQGNDRWHMSASNTKAVAAGLGFRGLDVTVRDTLAWWETVAAKRREKPGFSIQPEQEARALAAWRARGSA